VVFFWINLKESLSLCPLSTLRYLRNLKEKNMKIILDQWFYATLEEALPHLSEATEVEIWDCDTLTSIEAPNANRLDVLKCDALTSINAPKARGVDVCQCDSLTGIDAPLATNVEIRKCKALKKFGIYTQLSDAQCKVNLKIVAEIALASPEALSMYDVHACETTHCIAGTATHFLEGGKDMETKLGWHLAGQFLLGKDAASHFYDNQEDGRKYLQGVVAEV
jgi:hypothetical protein